MRQRGSFFRPVNQAAKKEQRKERHRAEEDHQELREGHCSKGSGFAGRGHHSTIVPAAPGPAMIDFDQPRAATTMISTL